MQNSSMRRARARFGDWMPGSVILLLISVLLLTGSLYGQEPNGTAPDPFGSVQKNLDLAADAHIALARSSSTPLGNPPPHGAARVKRDKTWPAELPLGDSQATGTQSSEQRFLAIGVDAGKILSEEGVPLALLAIARVESNFNPLALSPKGALGLWQLMPETARRYGLRVDAGRDERLDAEKSTRAAARYLRDLHAQFGSWDLALAGYNAGEDVVERAIKRSKTRNFNLLAQAGMLPLETRNYVPAVLSAMDAIRESRARYVATRARQSAMAAIVYAIDHAEN